MKPPVEAPISRQTRSVDVDGEMIERGGQLEAAAADVGRAVEDFDGGIDGDGLAGLGGLAAVDEDLAGHDERLRFLARFRPAAFDQEPVERAAS